MKQLIVFYNSIKSSGSFQVENTAINMQRKVKRKLGDRRLSLALPEHRRVLINRAGSFSSDGTQSVKSFNSRGSTGSILLDDSQLNCLIANDEVMQLSILEQLFKNENFKVMTSRNGFEAFEYVQRNFKENNMSFDLIILDLNMPIADGYEAIKNINNLYENHNLFKVTQDHAPKSQRRQSFRSDMSSMNKEEMTKPVIIACSALVNE